MSTSGVSSYWNRVFGTPTEQMWPGLTMLPGQSASSTAQSDTDGMPSDYQPVFPNWKPGKISDILSHLDQNGFDLFNVSRGADLSSHGVLHRKTAHDEVRPTSTDQRQNLTATSLLYSASPSLAVLHGIRERPCETLHANTSDTTHSLAYECTNRSYGFAHLALAFLHVKSHCYSCPVTVCRRLIVYIVFITA